MVFAFVCKAEFNTGHSALSESRIGFKFNRLVGHSNINKNRKKGVLFVTI